MQYSAAYLTGGTLAESDYTVWAALAATSKFSITIDGTARTNINPDFTAATSMASVASILQTTIRAVTSGQETVVWSTDHFVITSGNTTYASAITVARAPSSGVDLSSATYMDCAANGVVTNVSASLGMTVNDIYGAVALELFDDSSDTSLDQNKFRTYLNDGYSEALSRIKRVDPNFDITDGTTFDITAIADEHEQSFSLDTYAPSCGTILRVDYVNDNATIIDETTPIEETEYDEKTVKTKLRWCRRGSQIVFRGVYDDVDNVTIRYRAKTTALIAGTDRPSFPDQNYHSILVDYVVARYYKAENLETPWENFMANFERRLQELIDSLEPTDEPVTLQPAYEDGDPYLAGKNLLPRDRNL